jgi:hypothetical protein
MVTPEMIEAARALLRGRGFRADWGQIYLAMKALDPEINWMREALEIISDHETDAPCYTAEEADMRTIREMRAAANFALAQTQSQAQDDER